MVNTQAIPTSDKSEGVAKEIQRADKHVQKADQ